MIISVIPNIDKPGCSETLEKIGVFLKENGVKGYIPENIYCSNFESVSDDELFRLPKKKITKKPPNIKNLL